MVDLLGSRLEAYGVLRVVDPARFLAQFAEAESTGGIAAAESATAQAFARRFDATLYLTGTVMRLGDVIEISAVLRDQSGEPRATVRREAADESALGHAVDEIVRELLGRRWSRPADRLLRLAVVETASPEALRTYLAGERAFRQGDHVTARAHFTAATEADTLFALAFYRLSVTGGWLADSIAYRRGAERAAALAGRLSRRDAALINAHLAYVQGRVDDSERFYREIVSQYLDDAEAWYNLGELLFHQNPRRGRAMSEAREPFERAAAILGPTVESAGHLIALRLMAGERATLLPAFDSIFLLLPDSAPRRRSYSVLRALAREDDAELARALDALREREASEVFGTAWAVSNFTDRFALLDTILAPRTTSATQAPTRAAALGFLAHAAAARGDGAALRRALQQLATIDHATALETRAWLLAQPWLESTAAERSALRTALGAAPHERYLPGVMHFTPDSMQQPALRDYLVALLSLRDGDTAAVETALAALEQRSAHSGGPAFASSLRGELLLARGQPEQALQLLERSLPGPLPDMPQFAVVRDRLTRARALAALGRGDEARGWFQSCRVIFAFDFAWRREAAREEREAS
jgi:tetratricopeptide (TPR) repeat protein